MVSIYVISNATHITGVMPKPPEPVPSAGESFVAIDSELNYNMDYGHRQSKTLTIYGLANGSQIRVVPTELDDKNSGRIIEPDHIQLNYTSKPLTVTIRNGESLSIPVTIEAVNRGSFTGSIVLIGQTGSLKVPVTVSTEVLLSKAAVLVFRAEKTYQRTIR
jgi:hypothetical protein